MTCSLPGALLKTKELQSWNNFNHDIVLIIIKKSVTESRGKTVVFTSKDQGNITQLTFEAILEKEVRF